MLVQNSAPATGRKQRQFFKNITKVVRINDEILFSQGKFDAEKIQQRQCLFSYSIICIKFCYKDAKTLLEIFLLHLLITYSPYPTPKE